MYRTFIFTFLAAAVFLPGNPAALAATPTNQAQTQPETVQEYLARTIAEAQTADSMTIARWTAKHPEDQVETRLQARNSDTFWGDWNTGEKGLEQHWCLKSTADIPLAGGILVRRIALFYQPIFYLGGSPPAPPLPTESGAALRQTRCRLLRILNEFDGVSAPQAFAGTLAQGITGKPSVQLTPLGENATGYWVPVFSGGYFINNGLDGVDIGAGHWTVYVPGDMRRNIDEGDVDKTDVVLEWSVVSLTYGPPPEDTLNPLAGQPWIAAHAAMLARMPEGITLQMLSILAPQVGRWDEQPALYCHRDVVPVLRAWLSLAANAPPNQHAAALIVADQIAALRLPDCVEFAEGGYDGAIQDPGDAQPALEKELAGLGIDMFEGMHPFVERYSGSLLDQASKLAPTGAVRKVDRVAWLDQHECETNANVDTVDCTGLVREGEKFLSDYPDDAWAPNVHLLLAEAYSIMVAQSEPGSDAPASDLQQDAWLKKEDEHLRAWYAGSRNDRDRALVWQEIWGTQAGSGPWLLLPDYLRN
jgi:hypothetical protein